MTKKRVALILASGYAIATTVGVLNYEPSLADKEERVVFKRVIKAETEYKAWRKSEDERIVREAEEELARKREEERKRAEKTNYPYYNKQNVAQKSNISYNKLHEGLNGTNLAPLTQYFIQAEEKYGVNALFLTSVIALESGWGTSTRAIRDNNLSGYAIYSRGSSYSFSSKEECIMETARLLSEDYLKSSGKYHRGTSIYNINELYCESKDWASKVDSIARSLK